MSKTPQPRVWAIRKAMDNGEIRRIPRQCSKCKCGKALYYHGDDPLCRPCTLEVVEKRDPGDGEGELEKGGFDLAFKVV